MLKMRLCSFVKRQLKQTSMFSFKKKDIKTQNYSPSKPSFRKSSAIIGTENCLRLVYFKSQLVLTRLFETGENDSKTLVRLLLFPFGLKNYEFLL